MPTFPISFAASAVGAFAAVAALAGCAQGKSGAGSSALPATAPSGPTHAALVQALPATSRNALYISNRDPLAPSPAVRLPIGAITPKGWLRSMLELERDGMTGHLEEISHWCKYDGNPWIEPEKTGGWEELPYWLKGYGDLGYVLNDETIIKESRKWIDGILKTQQPDGWFGPLALKTSLKGKPDVWPHMLVLNVLQSFYERTEDPRVLPFMTNYFKWANTSPDANILTGYWDKIRGGDMLEEIYWLYNRTGDAWLLDLAKKVHTRTSNWTSGVINLHGVNITQSFREPTVYWMQSGEPHHFDGAQRNYDDVMGRFGQVPGGMFGADENARKGMGDPRQGAETCSMVEFMHSFEMLTRITGESDWADHCEDVAFNSLPASSTPDMRGLHYLTAPNQVQLDRGNKAPGIQNTGTMFSYSPSEAPFRCCQHNVAMGWPYFAEELWAATSDQGLCAALYSASDVTAKVAGGQAVTISEEGDYPFDDKITFKLSTGSPVAFPLYLRLPRWCKAPAVAVNGEALQTAGQQGGWIKLTRTWKSGDVVTLELPMEVSARTWAKNADSVSVDYGPLTFSLDIAETWKPYGNSKAWPGFEVFPAAPWNYGLVIDPRDVAGSFTISHRPGELARQPFTSETAPITLTASARRIPGWRQDPNGLVSRLQPSPVQSDEPVETVKLIPMGAARLRISAFPTIGAGADAHPWQALTATASHTSANDSADAMSDGILPKSSSDDSIPRFTWWDHRGTAEWVQYDFAAPRKVAGVSVYWFDDESKRGGCRPPASWKVMVKDSAGQWKDVSGASAYGAETDRLNEVKFDGVETQSIRIEAQLQPSFSAGILEWIVQ